MKAKIPYLTAKPGRHGSPRWTKADGALVLRQSKKGRRVALPLHLIPNVVARLEAETARDGAVQSATHLLVNDRTCRPWTGDAFKKAFADVRHRAAGARPACADLWFMELRHSAITRLHDAGVDALDIASITGRATASVIALLDKHYLIRSSKQAEAAFKRRLDAEKA